MKRMIIFFLSAAFPCLVMADTYYVPGNYSTIQAAIDAAQSGDTVIVAPGHYPEALVFNTNKGVIVKSSEGAKKTCIDATGLNQSTITFLEDADSVLDGFTVTGGGGPNVDYGGGIYCFNPGDTQILNNTIEYNTAEEGGGGIYHQGSGYSDYINFNTIQYNEAPNGGGIFFDESNIATYNNLIIYNIAIGTYHFSGEGGGVYCTANSMPRLQCNTISFNHAAGNHGDGGGIYVLGSSPYIYYTNIWGNTANYNESIYVSWESYPVVRYCNIEGGFIGGAHIIDVDPLFVSPATGDCHLSEDSPCIDAGLFTSTVVDKDIDGEPRNIDSDLDGWVTVDIGYDEYMPPGAVLNVPSDGFETIQSMIDVMVEDCTLLVAPGTYLENVEILAKGISIRSDGDGDPITHDIAPKDTIIDGNQAGSVVLIEGGNEKSIEIRGFTLTNGLAENGGGICSIESEPRVSQCIISDNTATESGGGIGCSGGRIEIFNNLIFGNTTKLGGGIECYYSVAQIIGSTICGNIASDGGGGIQVWESSPLIMNSILWENSAPQGSQININISGHPYVKTCVVQGGYSSGYNILDADPLFSDPGSKDYHLTPASPCINRATWVGLVGYDLDGDARCYMGSPDLGADEFIGTHSLEADAFTLSESTGGEINFTLTTGTPYAGRKYVMLAGISGTMPGTPLPLNKTALALNWDIITDMVLIYLNTPFFENFYGFMDGSGQATARFNTLGPMDPGSVGIVNSFAYCLGWPWDFASNPINVEIVP